MPPRKWQIYQLCFLPHVGQPGDHVLAVRLACLEMPTRQMASEALSTESDFLSLARAQISSLQQAEVGQDARLPLVGRQHLLRVPGWKDASPQHQACPAQPPGASAMLIVPVGLVHFFLWVRDTHTAQDREHLRRMCNHAFACRCQCGHLDKT